MAYSLGHLLRIRQESPLDHRLQVKYIDSMTVAASNDRRWVEREALRKKGQFWTPDWVADAMVSYVARDRSCLFDPAFGVGAFALAAARESSRIGVPLTVRGSELDQNTLEQALANGVDQATIERVDLENFLKRSELPEDCGVIANPPYIRHHRISAEEKASLRAMAIQRIGAPLDGRAGIHAFFLIHALSLLSKGAPLAFIVPSDICEGVYARALWTWIARKFRIEAIVTFAAAATPFPRVDTNPLIALLRNASPTDTFVWSRVQSVHATELRDWVADGFPSGKYASIQREDRSLTAALRYGLTRIRVGDTGDVAKLGDYFRIMRGIATGANDFFFLTSERIRELGLPLKYFVRAVGRTRDIPDESLSAEQLDELDKKGRPTFLLSIGDVPLASLPPQLQEYLRRGMEGGIAAKTLISTRRPWYRMERRHVPEILFSYLGRRSSRFIYNEAGALPLTGFLCVYPGGNTVPRGTRISPLPDPMGLVAELNRADVLNALPMVAKSYGSGALKVEPRMLEALPLSAKTAKKLNEIVSACSPQLSAAPTALAELDLGL